MFPTYILCYSEKKTQLQERGGENYKKQKLRWMMSLLKCIKSDSGFNVISIQLGYSGSKKLVIHLATSSLVVQEGPRLGFQK